MIIFFYGSMMGQVFFFVWLRRLYCRNPLDIKIDINVYKMGVKQPQTDYNPHLLSHPDVI